MYLSSSKNKIRLTKELDAYLFVFFLQQKDKTSLDEGREIEYRLLYRRVIVNFWIPK